MSPNALLIVCVCLLTLLFVYTVQIVKTESRRWHSFSMHLIEMNTPLN